MCEVCTKLKIKTQERCLWRFSGDSGVSIVDFVNTDWGKKSFKPIFLAKKCGDLGKYNWL